MPMLWQIEPLDPLALDKLRQLRFFWWRIRQHRLLNLASLIFLNESCSILDTLQRRRSSKCATGNDFLSNSGIVGGTMIERNLIMAENHTHRGNSRRPGCRDRTFGFRRLDNDERKAGRLL